MIVPARIRADAPMRVAPTMPGRPDGYPSSTPGSIAAPAPMWTSTAPGTPHLNSGTSGGDRRLARGEGARDADAEARGDRRRPAGEQGIQEVAALVLQRLARFDLRTDDVAVTHEQLELAVRVRNRLADRDAALEHPHPFGVVQIVEDDAPPAADRDDLADLVRIGPADMDVADDAVRVAERREGDVVAIGAEHARADRGRPLRLLVEQVIEDRDIVRRQVPDGVDVVPDRAEVGSRRVQVVRLAELRGAHVLL